VRLGEVGIDKAEVWVAATDPSNPYQPDDRADGSTANNPAVSFQLIDDVRIMGGFLGTEIDKDDRNALNNITVLSGDLAGDDVDLITGDVNAIVATRDDNSFHVVRADPDVGVTAILDGFRVTHGAAFDQGSVGSSGGGILVWHSEPRILRCTFTQNMAGKEGAGAAVLGRTQLDPPGPEDPLFSNCRFFMNRMDIAGGGGGGLAIANADPALVNCLFHDNYASAGDTLGGGGLRIGSSGLGGPSTVTLVNCCSSSRTGGRAPRRRRRARGTSAETT
jgi:hypothetical protein